MVASMPAMPAPSCSSLPDLPENPKPNFQCPRGNPGVLFAPPIFFEKENAPRPVEKKRFSFGFVAPASIGRYRSSAQLKIRLRLTNLVPAFYCKCLREVQQPPNCAPISGGPRSRPRPASLAPAGQFTSSQSPKDSACQIGASFSPRDCTTGIPFGHHGASPLAMTWYFYMQHQ